MNKNMVFTDVDGTLLTRSKIMSQENEKAIFRATALGVPVIFNTGRLWTAVKSYYRQANLNTPVSACNGAVIVLPHAKRVLYDSPLKKDVLAKILGILSQIDVYHHLYSLDSIISKEYKFTTAYYEAFNKTMTNPEDCINIQIVDRFTPKIYDAVSIYKVMVASKDGIKINACWSLLKEIPGITITQSSSENIEIMNCGVNKGYAMKFICNYFNAPNSNTMAIGDALNDIPMLRSSCYPVAMENSIAELKKLALHIAPDCDNNGFAKAVNIFLDQS